MGVFASWMAPTSTAQENQLTLEIVKLDGHLQIVASSPKLTELITSVDAADKRDWNSVFKVFAGDAKATAVLGTARIDRNRGCLIFKPRFQIADGRKFRVSILVGATSMESEVTAPATPKLPVKITQVFPTSDKLPENQLKFYLVFSAPMRTGEVYKYVHLEDESGAKIELPFLEIEQELWSRDRRRLTLLIDPGRIKRGLVPREEMGPVLVAGKGYRLVVSKKWRGANGSPLTAPWRKKFRVVKADEQQPNPKRWQVVVPERDSKQPLKIKFGESLDRAMLDWAIEIVKNGVSLKGAIVVGKNEATWQFQPFAKWAGGEYETRVDRRLEDLAGNNMERKFDVDRFERTEKPVVRTTTLKFHIK